MTGKYLRVSQAELEAYLQDRSMLEGRIYSENIASDHNLIDLDKALEGLFFLLTGASQTTIEKATEPLSLILTGTLIIDPEQDSGCGPVTYMTSEQVKRISAALDRVTADALYSRYDADKMMALHIYPEIWNEDDAIEYLIENFDRLKAFYNAAVSENQSVVFFVC
ncbi:conserved hypothetical protein [Cytophaga hutchinsonii ATCC 33406]|uniref:DUF1877 family protein n=2 Tax=Cytophaga hutchinsonii TaxID=985 RepID=A0A6N4SPZ4_CYTH3|nr:conserved hypothetical protein [Cytophaga hutchinsonii ATCC 33406]